MNVVHVAHALDILQTLLQAPDVDVRRRALEQDVLYVPGNLCYADDVTRRKPSHEMRLSFGAAPEADIRRGIRRLGRVIGKN